MVWVVFVLSIVLTCIICSIINKNTIGTTGAYVKRALIVWVVCFFALGALFGLG